MAGLTTPDRREIGRHVEHRDVAEPPALIEEHSAEHAIAEPARIAEHRVEYWLQLAGGGRDDAQYLGGRGLLLQGLARLGDQPRVLHRDHRLRREILQKRDLLVGERTDLLAEDCYLTEK